MNYWRDDMNWPLSNKWSCEVCGGRALEWGFVHGRCRCIRCHTQYYMYDENREATDMPVCKLKPEYNLAVKYLWMEYGMKVDDMDTETLKKAQETVRGWR